MPYSKQTFSYAGGARTFTISLAFGYIAEADIKVYVVGELTGGGAQIFRTFTFDSEFVVNVTESITNPSSVVVQRTVSPSVFVVDFEAGADITNKNVMTAFKQNFMLMQEILDGRVDDVDLVAKAAAAAVSAAAAAASAVSAAADAASIDPDELILRDGSVAFTAKILGIAPTSDLHLSTKKYVDDVVGGGGVMLLSGTNQMVAAMKLVAASPTLDDHATRKKYVNDQDALKANLASPALTGNPTAPTQSALNNSTRLATTAYVDGIGLGAFGTALMHVRDQKSQGTHAGTFTNGAWRTRVLNTVVTNEIGSATLVANVISLPAGTYYFKARAPATYTSDDAGHQAKLRNITDSSDEIIGTSCGGGSGSKTTSISFVEGRFIIAGTKTFELQHRTVKTQNTHGLGQAINLTTEVYAEVMIWKVA